MPPVDPSTPQTTPSSVGVVVIGRNEGQRLLDCLRGVLLHRSTVLYVDSGSTDGSPDNARALGVAVLQLDAARPFSAARARNEGAQALLKQHPDLAFVQFLDGDCLIDQF